MTFNKLIKSIFIQCPIYFTISGHMCRLALFLSCHVDDVHHKLQEFSLKALPLLLTNTIWGKLKTKPSEC